MGTCVRCNYNVFPSIFSTKAEDKHKESFVNTCLPRALDANGVVKAAFRCTGGDDFDVCAVCHAAAVRGTIRPVHASRREQ